VLRREHDAEVNRLRKAYESHNTAMILEHRSAINSMNQRLQEAEHNRQTQLNQLQQKHRNEVVAMQREHDSDTRGMVAVQDQSASNYKKELNRLSEEMLAKEALHDAEKSRMNAQFLEEKRRLTIELDAIKDVSRVGRRRETVEVKPLKNASRNSPDRDAQDERGDYYDPRVVYNDRDERRDEYIPRDVYNERDEQRDEYSSRDVYNDRDEQRDEYSSRDVYNGRDEQRDEYSPRGESHKLKAESQKRSTTLSGIFNRANERANELFGGKRDVADQRRRR
jgi:hypothetical protein